MSQIGKISVEDAKRLGKQLRARGVIVIAFDDESIAGASYGKRKRDCEDMRALVDSVVDAIENDVFSVWTKRNAGGKLVEQRKKPCAIGIFCSEHNHVHGAEAEMLRASIEQYMSGTLCDDDDADDVRRDLQRILDKIDARDSLAYLEANADREKAPHNEEPSHHLQALRAVLKRMRWDDQGGYPGFYNGKWDEGSHGMAASPEELDALFALAGIEPDEIVAKGSCADCRHAVNGRERGYTQPCLSCKRPIMSNFEPKEAT